MLDNLINSQKYKDFTSTQVKDLLNYLVNEKIEFSLTANTKGVDFNPEIPDSISGSFSQFTLFTLANYTFESIVIEDDIISFEAGFGSENFGSVCSVPFYAVFQISIDNSILFINPSATVEKYFNEDKNEKEQKERSMNAFKLNK
ncbi:MAG TPA: hypothetical protein EYG97_03030 [Arcobacter sp.]|nr:hypothetical protein [Arcobacter sp.]HIP55974.1 hypothetical protein [Arcobacter sp.]